MRAKRILRIVAILVMMCVLFGGTAIGAIFWHIHRSVCDYCAVAQQAYPHPGDDVTALIEFMDSDAYPLRYRNLSVWTLGRLRDRRALPSLTAAYTGSLCDHEKTLCQYELEKAIRLCDGTPKPLCETREASRSHSNE